MKFEKTKEVLNQLVADLSQMSMVIHQTHWYMRGPGFLTLHPMMDDFMDDVNGDDPTQDIFIEFKTATEKRIWMIQAHLGKAPEIDA